MTPDDSFLVTMSVGELGTNCYIVLPKTGNRATVIDPGAEGVRIAEFLNQHGLELEQIILTHGHIDHVYGLPELLYAVDPEKQVIIRIHPADRPLLDQVHMQASFMGYPPLNLPSDLEDLDPVSLLTVAERDVEIIHTPGHSLGSVCLNFCNESAVLTGDTLFNGGVGRTDLFGGSGQQLRQSLLDKVLVLDPKFAVFPGHGPATTIGEARLFVEEMFPFIR